VPLTSATAISVRADGIEVPVVQRPLPFGGGTSSKRLVCGLVRGDTDQMQTDYLVTVWYEGEPKKPAAKKSARR
jgi:hypothetical protein